MLCFIFDKVDYVGVCSELPAFKVRVYVYLPCTLDTVWGMASSEAQARFHGL